MTLPPLDVFIVASVILLFLAETCVRLWEYGKDP
jgi:hypothetical protein